MAKEIHPKDTTRNMAYELPISFQFHHTQMDGAHAGRFLANLQAEINSIWPKSVLLNSDRYLSYMSGYCIEKCDSHFLYLLI